MTKSEAGYTYPQEINAAEWCEITPEARDYLLEVLPPIYLNGAFAVSEPARHTADGVPVYCTVLTCKGRSYARELPVNVAESEARALRAALLS